MIKNNDPKSVITWDFDCTKAHVLFTVYHTDKELPNDLGGMYRKYCFDNNKKLINSNFSCRQLFVNI